MATNFIHDRGRGPEIVGTRITVDNLLPYFLDPTATEAFICRLYELSPEQVAAARAFVLNNPETVLTAHLQIEARMAAGNPPLLIEQAKKTHVALMNFKEWLVERQREAAREQSSETASENERNGSGRLPTFREWLAERESQPAEGT